MAIIADQDRNIIQKNWNQIQPKGLQIVATFYYELFQKYPSLQPLFTNNPYRQNVKFRDMLDLMIQGLDNPEQLSEVLQASGSRHKEYGVKDEFYSPVGQILIHAIREASEDLWNTELETAWNNLLRFVIASMIAKED